MRHKITIKRPIIPTRKMSYPLLLLLVPRPILAPSLLSEGQYRVLDYYNKGMEAYEAFDFPTARDLFRQALEVDPTDGPSLLYVDRCADFILNPLGDLIFRAQSK